MLCFDDTKFFNYYKTQNENAVTKHTVFSPHSATAEQQLTY